MTSATIIWDSPSTSSHPNPYVLKPLDSFEVWVHRADEEDYQTLSSVDSNVLRVNVTGLHPGTFYWMVVASINTAGSSLSNAINITTLSSGMYVQGGILKFFSQHSVCDHQFDVYISCSITFK